MRSKRLLYSLVSILLTIFHAQSQDQSEPTSPLQIQKEGAALTLQVAMSMALEKNHQIQVSKLRSSATEKDLSMGNAGLLPSVDAVAGGNYSNNTSDVTFAGSIPALKGANAITKGYSAGLQVSYLLFDGLGTFNSYKKLKAAVEISEIQSKISIEGTMMQVVANYFEVVRNQDLLQVYKQTLALSKERLVRVKNNVKYGSAAKIELLNAQVDYNNDYSNFLGQKQNLKAAKRQLNYFLGQELTTDFVAQQSFEIKPLFPKDSLRSLVLTNNSSIVLSQLNVSAAEIDKKLAGSQFAPKISMNASYGLNYSENNASIMLKSSSIGFTGALSLSWNLFKGMSHKKALEKSKILLEANEVLKRESALALEKEFLDVYDQLQLNLALVKLEKENILGAQQNLNRSKELYYNGTINNVQFRQAQINLLLAKSKLDNLMFQSKIQEYQVLRLSNRLLI